LSGFGRVLLERKNSAKPYLPIDRAINKGSCYVEVYICFKKTLQFKEMDHGWLPRTPSFSVDFKTWSSYSLSFVFFFLVVVSYIPCLDRCTFAIKFAVDK
jgi:hypothetical protein